MAVEIRRLTGVVLVGLVSMLIAGCGRGTSTTSSLPTPTRALTLIPTPTLPPSPVPTPLPPTSVSPLGPWESLPTEGLPGPWVQQVAFAFNDVAFAIAEGDLYRSDDGGVSWQLVLDEMRSLMSVAVSPAYETDRSVFAADGRGLVFRSIDGGDSWQQMGRVTQVNGASDVNVWLTLSPSFPDDPTLFAAAGELYRSSDGGLTWEAMSDLAARVRDAPLALSPGYPNDPVESIKLVPLTVQSYRTPYQGKDN